MSLSAIEAYRNARRLGKKYITEQNNRNLSGLLPVLGPQLEEICSEFPLGLKEIPLDKIRGTFATGRASAFAGNFMPLLEESTEFSKKWRDLYASAAQKGVTEPIKAYEYLGYYYVLEGHKRVSVSLCLSAYSLSAQITRLLPPLHEDNPLHAVYLEYIKPDRKLPVGHLWFSVPGRLSELRSLSEKAYKESPGLYDSAEALLHGLFYAFRTAYHKLGLQKNLPEITTGDAFWQYAGIFGLPLALSPAELQKNIKTCEPQLAAMVKDVHLQVISTPSDLETRQGLLSFFRTGRVSMLFAYCGLPGSRFSATVHEIGRFALSRGFPQLDITVADGIPSDGTGYERLRDAMKQTKPHILFATDATMGTAALRLSLEFKSSLVLYSHDQIPGLLGTYYTNTAEPAFLMGVLAGALTGTGKIGYLRPSVALGGREQDMQAFAQGIKTVRPSAEVYYSIPRKRNKEDRILPRWAEMGLDTAWIPQFYGYPSPAHKTFPGVYASLCSLSPNGEPWDIYACSAWHWDAFYTRLAAELLEGSPDALSSQAGRLHFRLGLQSGVMNVHPAGPVLGHWPRQLLKEFHAAIIRGLNPLDEDHPVEIIEI